MSERAFASPRLRIRLEISSASSRTRTSEKVDPLRTVVYSAHCCTASEQVYAPPADICGWIRGLGPLESLQAVVAARIARGTHSNLPRNRAPSAAGLWVSHKSCRR